MAPDINTLPVSPRPERAAQPSSQTPSASASRRTSMLPPAVPASATAASPSTSAQNPPPHQRSPVISSNEQLGVPLRHPRPLTAAELYLECEKEQEAVVNRLTRELTALRAQSASVASNASSTSSGVPPSLLPVDISDPNPTHQMTGPTHPTPSRRPRSSSSVSGRSIPTSATSAHGPFSANAGGGASVSQASVDRAMAAAGTEHGLSRQTSISASGTSTPARQSIDFSRSSNPRDPRPQTLSRAPSQSALTAQSSSNPQVQTALQHVADTAAYRSEMEIVKAENEALRQRVRALERALRNAQGSSSGGGGATAMSASLSASSHSQHQYPPHGPARRSRRDSSVSDASSLRAVTSEPSSAPSLSAAAGGLPGTSPSTTTTAPLPIRTPSSSNRDSIGGAIAAWASHPHQHHHDGGIGGVAPPRERSESQSTSASSSRRPIAVVGVTDEDVRVGESAASRGAVGGAGGGR